MLLPACLALVRRMTTLGFPVIVRRVTTLGFPAPAELVAGPTVSFARVRRAHLGTKHLIFALQERLRGTAHFLHRCVHLLQIVAALHDFLPPEFPDSA